MSPVCVFLTPEMQFSKKLALICESPGFILARAAPKLRTNCSTSAHNFSQTRSKHLQHSYKTQKRRLYVLVVLKMTRE